MKLTINDIARIAGVSKATVSRVLNNKPDVNAAMRERILSIMKENGYRPNAQAVAVAKQRNMSVAILIPSEFSNSLMNEYYLALVQEMSRHLDEKGYYTLFVYPDSGRGLELVEMNRVDGFIVLSSDVKTSELVRMIAEKGIPCVSTANQHGFTDLACFDIDNVQAGREATRYLIGKGHRTIAFVNFMSTLGFKDRYEGYLEAMREAGNEPGQESCIEVGTPTSEAAKKAFVEFWNKGNRPTAVFTCNDTAARGVYAAAYELRVRIPDELSIISVDDQVASEYMTPPLTTINQSIHAKALMATERLVGYIETGIRPSSDILPFSIVERSSVKGI